MLACERKSEDVRERDREKWKIAPFLVPMLMNFVSDCRSLMCFFGFFCVAMGAPMMMHCIGMPCAFDTMCFCVVCIDSVCM